MVGVFFQIFLYEFFGLSLVALLLFNAAIAIIRPPFQIGAAKLFSRIGLVPSMIIGTLGVSLFYFCFFLLDSGAPIHDWWLIGTGVVGLVLVNAFYWAPFHIDFAEFSPKKKGKSLAKIFAMQRVLGVIGPLLAGWIILKLGFYANFLIGFGLNLISVIPLFFLPAFKVQYEFGFFETFKKFVSKEYRPMTLSMMAYGAENIVGVVIWPIFLYEVFNGEYLQVGAFAAVVVVVALGLEFLVGTLTDKRSPQKMLKIGSGVYAAGWVGKGLVDTVIGVFAASTFHSLGLILYRSPFDALFYEEAADAGHYVDELTILRQVSLNIGRALILLVLVGLTAWFGIGISFFVAALVSLGANALLRFHATNS